MILLLIITKGDIYLYCSPVQSTQIQNNFFNDWKRTKQTSKQKKHHWRNMGMDKQQSKIQIYNNNNNNIYNITVVSE